MTAWVIVWIVQTSIRRSAAFRSARENKLRKPILLLLAAILTISASVTRADDDYAYTPGARPYRWLVRPAGHVRRIYALSRKHVQHLMDEYKKQGIIIDYSVYQARPRDPQDADLILTVTYKTWQRSMTCRRVPIPRLSRHWLPMAKAAWPQRIGGSSASKSAVRWFVN